MTDRPAEGAALYTLNQLHTDTEAVMREINESGRPAAITRHGRFLALITPLVDCNVEGAALAALLRAQEAQAGAPEAESTSPVAAPNGPSGAGPDRG